MVEVDDMVNRLKLLREQGQQIVLPLFTIMYNPYTDVFLMDVPEDRKELGFKAEECEAVFYWDCSTMYPKPVKFNGDYGDVWEELQIYADGATIDLIPTGYVEDKKEYIWVENYEKGQIALRKDKLQIIE